MHAIIAIENWVASNRGRLDLISAAGFADQHTENRILKKGDDGDGGDDVDSDDGRR